jgi:hydrogenase maturation factor
MSDGCPDDRCITCSDQLVRLLVMSVDESGAVARGTVDGERAEVGIELVGEVRAGDVLLCHAGVALQRDTAEVIT